MHLIGIDCDGISSTDVTMLKWYFIRVLIGLTCAIILLRRKQGNHALKIVCGQSLRAFFAFRIKLVGNKPSEDKTSLKSFVSEGALLM